MTFPGGPRPVFVNLLICQHPSSYGCLPTSSVINLSVSISFNVFITNPTQHKHKVMSSHQPTTSMPAPPPPPLDLLVGNTSTAPSSRVASDGSLRSIMLSMASSVNTEARLRKGGAVTLSSQETQVRTKQLRTFAWTHHWQGLYESTSLSDNPRLTSSLYYTPWSKHRRTLGPGATPSIDKCRGRRLGVWIKAQFTCSRMRLLEAAEVAGGSTTCSSSK